jgi:predicted peroxiredoxin
MRYKAIIACLALMFSAVSLLNTPSALASDTVAYTKGPLFINVTTDDTWRANMALSFANNAAKHGHKVTVFLNVEAVRLAAKSIPQNSDAVTGKTALELMQELLAQDGQIIVCPMCAKHAGIAKDDLIDGITHGKPEVTLPALFQENGRTLSY